MIDEFIKDFRFTNIIRFYILLTELGMLFYLLQTWNFVIYRIHLTDINKVENLDTQRKIDFESD